RARGPSHAKSAHVWRTTADPMPCIRAVSRGRLAHFLPKTTLTLLEAGRIRGLFKVTAAFVSESIRRRGMPMCGDVLRASFKWTLALLLLVVVLPTAAHAQSITGVVKDTSGAVLPGVTVEAASPALIEKSRTVVTDGGGQYRFV